MKNLLFSLLILIPFLSIQQVRANDGSWISSGSPKSATETESEEKLEDQENGDGKDKEEKKPNENKDGNN